MERDELKQFIDTAFVGLAVCEGGQLLLYNRAIAELFGASLSELVDHSLVDLAATECRATLADAIAVDCSPPTRITFLRRDGTRFDAEFDVRPISYETRTVQLLSVRDVSSWTRQIDQLQEQIKQLESSQSLAHLGSWEYSLDNQPGTWSQELFRIHRRQLNEGVPSEAEYLELIHPEDRNAVLEAREKGLRGEGLPVDYRTNPAQGPIRYLTAKIDSVKNAQGETIGLAGTGLDITDLRMTERALRESERRYRQLFANAPMGIGLTTENGDIVDFNDAMMNIGGYEPTDFGEITNVSQLYDDIEDRKRLMSMVKEQGSAKQQQIKFRRKDGGTYDAEISIAPVVISGRRYMLAMVVDISDRKRSERQLQERETRFRALIENAYDVITLFDQDGRIIYSSPSLKRALGYEPKELEGRIGIELVHPDDIELAGKDMAQGLLSPGSALQSSYRLRHADGSYRHVEITGANLLGEPSVRALVSNMRDVTQQYLAEQDLRRSEAKYRSLFENATFGIYQSDVEGSFITVNPALVKMLGYESREELLRMDIKNLYVNPKQREELVDRCKQEGEFIPVELPWKRKDGSVITVYLNGRTIFNEENEIVAFEVVAEDVSTQRVLQEQLRHAQKMEAVGQLTGGIAHDFNNILTTVLGNAEMVSSKLLGSQDDLCQRVDQIRKAALRGAEMIKKLLAFSRKETLRFRAIDLTLLCEEITGMLEHILPESVDIRITSTIPGVLVRADRGAIEQILFNLAANSRDAMPGGGVLEIRLELQTIDEEFRSSHGWGDAGVYVSLVVNDSGIGMSEQVRRRSFDPFFTTKPPGQGTGLGMSMIYGLVKQHLGFVDVVSEPGKGTGVFIYLPVAAEEVSAAPTEEQEKLTAGGNETILVVEDDTSVRNLAKTILEEAGYGVLVAENGERALRWLYEGNVSIDLIITDIVMPKIGGLVLYQEVSKMNRNIPFLLTSGYSSIVEGPLAEIGPDVPLLDKPWTAAQLRNSVRAILDHNP